MNKLVTLPSKISFTYQTDYEKVINVKHGVVHWNGSPCANQ